jgi:hypothetical protein
MKSVLLGEAQAEMVDAARFYDSHLFGLGQRFLDAVERAISDIEANPRRWPAIARKVRRRLVGRFPYGVLYLMSGDKLIVVAVMHLHRRPQYWTKRLSKPDES